MKTIRILVALAAVLAIGVPAARAADWSDTQVNYRWGPDFREPANAEKIEKSYIGFTHASGYKYGQNFFNIDLIYSSIKDPNRGLNTVPEGAAEVYIVYRHTLSLSKVTGANLSFPFVKDVGVTFGADANTKNSVFSAKKVMPTAGLQLALDVPGFWNVGVLVNKEWGVNAITGTAVEFDPTLMLATAWFTPVYGPVSFEGFGSVNFPKGKDGFGNKTKTEVLLHPKVMADVATLWGSKGVAAGVGFQYWLNKFGNDHSADNSGGSYEKAIFVEAAYHF